VGIKSFDDERISSRIKNMHVYKTLISLKNTHPFDPHKDEPSNEKLKAQILRDEMETMRDSFRMCVRMLIHDLNRSDEPRRSRADTDDPRGSTGT